jgi:hypothetical protein
VVEIISPMTVANDRGISKLLAAAAKIDDLEQLRLCPRKVRTSAVFQVPVAHVQNVSVSNAQAVDSIIDGMPMAAAFEMPRCHARGYPVAHDCRQWRPSMLHPVSCSLDNNYNLGVVRLV